MAGRPVVEGGTIERIGPLHYLYRAQRHHPLNPCVLAEHTQRRFLSATGAARHYLRWDLHLPGDLNGYLVVK